LASTEHATDHFGRCHEWRDVGEHDDRDQESRADRANRHHEAHQPERYGVEADRPPAQPGELEASSREQDEDAEDEPERQ
jgi:hypothetical protein